jgi:hypothetical protein
MQSRFRIAVAGLLGAMTFAWLRAAEPTAQVTVVTDRQQAIYSIGEQARFLINRYPSHSPGGIGTGALASPCACEFGPFGCQTSCCASLCNLS